METVPREEIRQRINRFQTELAANGLEIDEYPIISPRFDGILEEGMVFALEPMFVLPKQGVVGLEDDYLVTSEGLERLTLTEQSLIQI
jgi:Xaa-Pro aminopeptidase